MRKFPFLEFSPYLLFLTFLAQLTAVLFRTLIVRDRLLDRMAIWRIRSRKTKSQS